MCPSKYRSKVKKHMKEAAFTELKETKANHEKVCPAIMKTFSSHKKYLLTNKLPNKQKGILFNLKCQTVRGIREDFSQMYFGDIQCCLCKGNRTIADLRYG